MLACDGIWDCLTNEKCIKILSEDYIKKMKKENKSTSYAVEMMFEDIVAPNTDEGIGTDNMTAILILFNNWMEYDSEESNKTNNKHIQMLLY